MHPLVLLLGLLTPNVFAAASNSSSSFMPSSASSLAPSDKIVVGYYVPWGKVEPEAIAYDKVTHINYGFGVLYKRDDPASIFVDRYYDGNKIRKIKSIAGPKGVKVLMSLGGWTGSQTFSLVAKDPALRKKFINNAMVFIRKNTLPDWETNPDGWDLDGIDIDWEYPGRNGAKCNIQSPQDSANYLVLLKELREAMDKEFPNEHKLLTAAVRVKPFDGPDGQPLKDVSEFAKYFDFINIMAYDINGSWSTSTGPNAPFNYETEKGGDPYSFTQSINSWLDAKFPANKLTAGLAFYGRSLTAKVDMNKDPNNQYVPKEPVTPKGDQSDANDPNFFCNEGTFYSGVYKYKFLRQDALIGGPYQAGNGFTRHYDPVSQTPWLYNQNTKLYVSYDDPQSIKVKVDYAISKGIRGVMYWDMSQDYNDELLDVARQIRGGAPNPPPTSPPTTSVPTSPPTSPPTTPPTTPPTETTAPPKPTGSCSEGTVQCADPNGKSSQYLRCVHGSWQSASCASGTVCRSSGSSIYCDFP